MISFFVKHKTSILLITLFFFLGSIAYLGLSAYSRTNYNLDAARVGNTTISTRQLDKLSERQAGYLRDQGVDVDEQMMNFLRQQTLSGLITVELLSQAAKQAGLFVSDYEVAYDIKTSPLFTLNGQFDKKHYAYAVRQMYQVSPAEFEQQYRRQTLADRFRQTLNSMYKLTPEEIKTSYQVQHGNLEGFEENKQDFKVALLETKLETAPDAFFETFTQTVPVKTFLE